jgi:chromosome segregation protein
MREELAGVREKLNDARAHGDELAEKLALDRRLVERQQADFEEQLAAARAAAGQGAAAGEELARLQAELAGIQGELSKARQEAAKGQEELQRLGDQADELRGEAKAARKEAELQQEQVEGQDKKLAEMQKTLAELEQQLSSVRRDRDAAEKARAEAELAASQAGSAPAASAGSGDSAKLAALVQDLYDVVSSFRSDLRALGDAGSLLASDDEDDRADGAEQLRDNLANANSRGTDLKNIASTLRDLLHN